MTIPPLSQPPGDSRLHFRNLRLLRDHMLSMGIPAQNLQELSMGMSSDYEVAIKEGATVIRLGTALFGPRLAKGKDPKPRRGTPKIENTHKVEGYLWAKRRPR